MRVDLLLVDVNLSDLNLFHLYIDYSELVFTVVLFMMSDCVSA